MVRSRRPSGVATSGASSRVNQFTIERFDAAYDARPGNDGRLELEVTENAAT